MNTFKYALILAMSSRSSGNHLSRRVVIDVNNFRIKWIFVPQTKIHARGYKICKRTNIIPHSRKEYRTKILTASQQ